MAKINKTFDTDKKFVLFPLSSLKIFLEDNDGLNILIDYGIKRLADTLEADTEDKVEKVEMALEKLCMTGSPQSILRRAAKVSEADGEPLIMVSVKFLLYARDHLKPNEQQKMALSLLFGLHSIIGMRRRWAATTKEMIMARMFGYLTPKREGKSHESKYIKDLWAKWTKRRRYESLVRWLQGAGLVKCYFGTSYRRTIVSVDGEWDAIKDEVADYFKRHKASSMQARKSREELAKMMNDEPPK